MCAEWRWRRRQDVEGDMARRRPKDTHTDIFSCVPLAGRTCDCPSRSLSLCVCVSVCVDVSVSVCVSLCIVLCGHVFIIIILMKRYVRCIIIMDFLFRPLARTVPTNEAPSVSPSAAIAPPSPRPVVPCLPSICGAESIK